MFTHKCTVTLPASECATERSMRHCSQVAFLLMALALGLYRHLLLLTALQLFFLCFHLDGDFFYKQCLCGLDFFENKGEKPKVFKNGVKHGRLHLLVMLWITSDIYCHSHATLSHFNIVKTLLFSRCNAKVWIKSVKCGLVCKTWGIHQHVWLNEFPFTQIVSTTFFFQQSTDSSSKIKR